MVQVVQVVGNFAGKGKAGTHGSWGPSVIRPNGIYILLDFASYGELNTLGVQVARQSWLVCERWGEEQCFGFVIGGVTGYVGSATAAFVLVYSRALLKLHES